MTPIVVRRTIAASPRKVFQTVADIRQMSQALPHVVGYEYLTQSQLGRGTRFRETRRMGSKNAVTELEVTEYVEDQRVRMVADSHGAVWDTTFVVTGSEHEAELTLTMDARAYRWMPRIFIPLTRGMIQKAVERDMDLVKEFCESSS